MVDEKIQDRSFELRSEKVRSIVGQIPSTLVRYGITVIGVVLVCLFAVAYFLPYKQVYSGTATIYEVPKTMRDSTEMTLLLQFERARPTHANRQKLSLEVGQSQIEGEILQLSSARDTLGRQETLCRFKTTDIQSLENQTVDVRLVHSSGNLLQRLLGDIGL
ncbi:hypothetical protein [Porphyromonas levii]|uniref:hypothetical protein n=1 Tax=Porphyromonas levii TaxID=28114 RepID=UPI001BA8A10C|nr:hypothetical protein [Porphyromonas levii]MBR8803422.1 hypothetical protein [Porphyromonas levii]